METRTLWNKTLLQRLRRGRGALARHGEFWYPVRVIHRESNQEWRVRWWRACEFTAAGVIPDTITTVAEDDIVDSLWNDSMGRRKIRLGKWTHSWDIPTSEDILADPSSIPYNNAIDTVLTPWEPILKRLLDAPDTVSADEAPAKAWLEGTTKKKKDISKELVPYVGSLSLTVRAQISNWFDVNIGKDRKKQHVWLGRLPIAHAYTVYIATNLKNDPKNSKLTGPELLEKAWDVQFSGTPSVLMDVDVDKDCLYILEEEMFERSARAGVAGHCQWGLDAGDHENWDPYEGIPPHFIHRDREESESELEVTSF
ncbi:hypothetical protein GALMADRAFT_80570 [Galerina marginata CBS 339.88]|uniref:Uncharacterized protein n=1 Tax=Galerina marginata (strain CBS 339.88) TaxID=685588 RepID=A0A067SG27_GALM3|nr:hypothetical protein GALMADRAFT_80570 [Galerina marginata CBS 339.88]